MKKLSLLLAALLILSSTVVSAEWETFKSADGMYEYTKDGVITAYYGDEFAFFPAEIDGTKINEIGDRIAGEYGIKHLPSDFKKKEGYKQSIELSQEYNLYRQNFCGCVFSKQEG